MKAQPRKLTLIAFSATLLAVVLYAGYYEFWLHKTSVKAPPIQPGPYFDTGVVATNGWEFQITNLFDLGHNSARQLQLCALSRQIFASFYDPKESSVVQWDLDTGRRRHIFLSSDNYRISSFAVSPDGEYLLVGQSLRDLSSKPLPADAWPFYDTKLFQVRNCLLVRDFGFVGIWPSLSRKVRFSSDSQAVSIPVNDSETVLQFGTQLSTSPQFANDEPGNPWVVPCSKMNWPNCGVLYRNAAGITNYIANSASCHISKDGRLIVVSVPPGDILLWDTGTCREIGRIRISNDGGCCIAFDEAKDRFLLADTSAYGSTCLRALVVTKRPLTDPHGSETAN